MFCNSEQKDTCREEKLGCKGCYYNDIENIIEYYTELKKYREIIKTIKPNYFFETVDAILQEYKNLKEENKSLEKQMDSLLDEQEEREKYTHSLEEQLKNSIPKSKIEEKIKELQKCNNNENNEMIICTNIMKMQVLEELLRESEENK